MAVIDFCLYAFADLCFNCCTLIWVSLLSIWLVAHGLLMVSPQTVVMSIGLLNLCFTVLHRIVIFGNPAVSACW